tara:strand:+ start:959 stop:1798 length:840 start_codon:yes stop_codon:yes gene_type:complete
MAITRATNLAAVGSGLGTSPAQPIDIGSGIQMDGSSTGVITATTFSGTATNAGSATGLGIGATGYGLVLSGDLTAANVTVGGTLTYDDVTNVDSIGLITARNGIIVNSGGVNVTGVVTATSFSGDGSNLSNVISGIDIESGGSFLGAGVTSVNFQSGATVTSSGAGATITISAGLNTTAGFSTNTNRILDLDSAQDHKYNVTGFVTFTCSGGTEGDSHTLRLVNSGIATVGFSTFFLFPSGSSPSLPSTDGAISLISFTVHRVGTGGTQLLSGASVNFS